METSYHWQVAKSMLVGARYSVSSGVDSQTHGSKKGITSIVSSLPRLRWCHWWITGNTWHTDSKGKGGKCNKVTQKVELHFLIHIIQLINEKKGKLLLGFWSEQTINLALVLYHQQIFYSYSHEGLFSAWAGGAAVPSRLSCSRELGNNCAFRWNAEHFRDFSRDYVTTGNLVATSWQHVLLGKPLILYPSQPTHPFLPSPCRFW